MIIGWIFCGVIGSLWIYLTYQKDQGYNIWCPTPLQILLLLFLAIFGIINLGIAFLIWLSFFGWDLIENSGFWKWFRTPICGKENK